MISISTHHGPNDKEDTSGAAARRLCFVTRSMGEISETWMWRQVTGFRRLRPSILTWRYVHRELFPVGDVPVHLQQQEACWPEETSPLMRRLHRLRNVPRWNFYAATREEYAAISKALNDIRPDVMLCQYGHMGLRMLPVARELAIPLVVHFHGSDLADGLTNRWYRWSIKSALHHFDAIVVVNTKQRDWVFQCGVAPEKVHVIPCGVPIDESTPRLSREQDGTPPQFIAVGRLVKLKGTDVTIRAFAGVAKQLPQARLVIVGDGPDRQELEALVRKLGIEGKVQFSGWLSQSEVRDKLRQSDVFVQHSVVPEGWPVSVAEASAMALPVVVTGCGGLADQVVNGVTGLIGPTYDVRTMKENMLRLACDLHLRATMGAAGRERMVRDFAVEKQIAKLEDVLLKCAHKM